MKTTAYVTDGHGRLNRTDRDLPELGEHDILLDVAAVSLNFRDIPFIRGDERRSPGLDRVPCSDAVGRVAAIGEGVSRFQIGDRVSPTVLPNWIDGPLDAAGLHEPFASHSRDGFLASKVIVPETALVTVPAYLSDLEAATLPCAALTAWHAIAELDAIREEQVVAIESTGGVAMFAAQIAMARRLKTIVTSRSKHKLERAEALGVWQTLDTSQTQDWDREVHALTNGRGAELVLDMGLKDGLPRSCRAASFEGTVAITGVVNGWQTSFDIAPVMNKNLRVRGVETGSRAMFERMNQFFEAKRLQPIIASVYHFHEIEEALNALAGSPFGKVVVQVTE